MSTVEHASAPVGDIELHYGLCRGQPEQPWVILCHGFPGLAYSWRNQLPALAEAGFNALAFDQRGYGRSSRPLDPAVYDSQHTVNDVVGLMDHLGLAQAVLVGHDFGAAQVYNVAVRHPSRVSAVVGVACPYDFDLAGRGGAGANPSPGTDYGRAFARPDKAPSTCFAEVAARHFYHMHYYQEPERPERELARAPRLFLTRLFWALCADGHLLDWTRFSTEGHNYLDVLADPAIPLPWPWMSEEDMNTYVEEFTRCAVGAEFIGGINSYRVADRNWELGKAWADAKVTPPSLFIAGSEDPVLQMIGTDALEVLARCSSDLRGIELIQRAGHFVQQEQPEAFNAALLHFLATL